MIKDNAHILIPNLVERKYIVQQGYTELSYSKMHWYNRGREAIQDYFSGVGYD
jgi:hypothetical protein